MAFKWLSSMIRGKKTEESGRKERAFLSDAEALFLSGYLKPNKEYLRGNFNGHSYQEWKSVLGKMPKTSFYSFLDSGWIVETGLLEKIIYQYKVSELKTLLKKYALPVSGNKHTLATRLVESYPDEMEKKTRNLQLYQCSEVGRKHANSYLEHVDNASSNMKNKVLGLLRENKFPDAVIAVHDFESQQVFSRGMDVDWGSKLSIASDVDKIQTIFKARPQQLEGVSDEAITHLRVAACMIALGVGPVSIIDESLPEDLHTGLDYENTDAALILFNYAHYKRELENINQKIRLYNNTFWGEEGERAGIEITSRDSGECKECERLVGIYDSMADVPDLPPKGCQNPATCRLQAMFKRNVL